MVGEFAPWCHVVGSVSQIRLVPSPYSAQHPRVSSTLTCIHIHTHTYIRIYISKGWSSPPWPNHRIHGNRVELRHSPRLDRLDRLDILQRDQKPRLCARFKNPFSLSLVPFPLLLCCRAESLVAEKSFSSQKFAALEIGSSAALFLPSSLPSYLATILPPWRLIRNVEPGIGRHPVTQISPLSRPRPSTELNISAPREDY